MAKPRSTLTSGIHIVDDRVLALGTWAGGKVVQSKFLAYPPGDIVIRTGGVAADAQPTDDIVTFIQRQPTAEDDDPSHALSSHGIRGSAELRRIAIRALRRGRAHSDDAVKTLPRLGQGEKIGR